MEIAWYTVGKLKEWYHLQKNLPQMCNVFQTNWWTHQLVDVYLWIPDKVAEKYVEFVGEFGRHLQKYMILAQSFWSRVRFELI